MLQLVLRTLNYFRNLLVPVALGVAVASAVIVGALVVGDSMRGSLRFIAMDRIGAIDSVLIAPRWFDENLSENVRKAQSKTTQIEVAVFVQTAIAERESNHANEMSLLGVEPSFWNLGTVEPKTTPGDEQVILNQSLAEKLKASVGDLITLRVASQAVVPADSPLGKREQDSTVLPRWKVIEILPDSSLARFSLRSDQRPIMNAFVSKTSLQNALEIDSKVNALFVAHQSTDSLTELLTPSLPDLGLRWEHVTANSPADRSSQPDSADANEASNASPILDYYHLTTDQMLITSKLSNAIEEVTSTSKPAAVLTYLANGVQKLDIDKPIGRNVPYSTISAVDWHVIEKMLDPNGGTKIPSDASDAVVITSWLATELNAGIGDKVRVEYFLPETIDGEEIEKSTEFTVVAIAPLTEPSSPFTRRKKALFDAPPTPFNDAAWTPVVPGITDQESISKWDTPFPLSRTIEPQDDAYWNSHRLTPKLYISKATGVKLFGSRFGNVSSIRFDGLNTVQASGIETNITSAARKQMASLGWREIPLRSQQLRAASGTTPFDALFLSLSFFVIVAALLLVALLFRLAIEQRADHWGLLMATGWTRKSVRRLLLLEGAVVSGVGAALGVVLGLGYAYAMIVGLRTWWVGAITVSFLDYHAQPLSLALGWLLGWLAALATIVITTRQLKQIPIARLLKRQMESSAMPSSSKGATRRKSWLAIGCVLVAVAVLVLGQFLQGQAQAGAFVGAGMLFLIGGMAWLFNNLKSIPGVVDAGVAGGGAMLSASTLASSNAKRAPTRSILAIGLVAIASFLILSMSLFQSAPNEAGTGGFAYVGKSTHAIHVDLNNPAAQRDVLGPKMADLQDLQFVPMRVRGGDDASCNNLYQASEPQVLGMSPKIDTMDRNAKGRSAFAWFATGKTEADRTAWSLLETQADGTEASPLPVILDQNTALWALHLGGYVGEKFSYTLDDRKVFFQTVGVLQNTILQGSLIIGEANFEKVFPSITGYRSFLLKSKIAVQNTAERQKSLESVRSIIEEGWAESGLSFASSDSILSQLLAVQNTYLGAFQVLGGLGLLLGTIGLGVAQLRSALERRGELAAMRAIGFTKSRLVWLLTLENGWQLLRGVGVGVGAAALATLPAILNGQPFSGLAWPSLMLLVVLLSGMICSILAAVGAMRWPLLASLRSDR